MSEQASSALRTLAAEAAAISLAAAPPEVVNQARLCILDTVGCMLAGTQTDESRLLRDCHPPEAAGAPGLPLATVAGTGRRQDIASAMQLNGYHGDVLELNDLIGGHASIGNVTAALALGEAQGASGAEVLEAVIRGIETTSRVYGAVYPTLKRFTDMGLVPVGIPSSIGSAVVAASLLRLSPEQTVNAMAIAGALAGWCPAEVIFGQGGTMKPLLFGAQPAAAGVTAARYARQGMTGPAHLLESKLGYFATASSGGALDPQPEPRAWSLALPRRKLHACCGYIHSAADALARLRGELGGDALRDALAIRIKVPPYVADVVGKAAPPTSSNDARFHLAYCMAVVGAGAGADVILPEHSIGFRERLASAEVKDLLGRIHVAPDAGLTHYHQCEVEVNLPGGDAPVKAVSSAPRGSPSQPLSDDDVRDKFLRLATPVIGAGRGAAFAAAVEDMAAARDVRALMATVM